LADVEDERVLSDDGEVEASSGDGDDDEEGGEVLSGMEDSCGDDDKGDVVDVGDGLDAFCCFSLISSSVCNFST